MVKRIRACFILSGVIFCVLWSLKIAGNKNRNVYKILKYEPGKVMSYNGIEITTKNVCLYDVDSFLECYGQEYSANYDEEFLKNMGGTRVLVYTFQIKNTTEKEYSLEALFGAYVRMEHRWISAFDPFTAQSLNPVFGRRIHTAALRPGEQMDLTFTTDINHIMLTDETWEHLADYTYTLCLGGYQDGYYTYELKFRIEEEIAADD